MLRSLTLIVALLALAISGANASEVILKTDGNGNGRTISFETEGPWLLAWRVNSNFRSQSGFELNLINADTGFFDSRILLMRGRGGNGLKLFENRGRFQFEVVSNFADWYLTVEQLTEEEAEAYRATAN
ncbi:MAG: hypothetical protein AAAFM81_10420 [Pseudomonadota bacterium]